MHEWCRWRDTSYGEISWFVNLPLNNGSKETPSTMLPPHPPNGIIPPTPHNKIQVPLKQYTIHCIFEEKK